MAVTLELSVVNTQQTHQAAQVMSIGEAGATIGRGADNTCVLEDVNRFISARHAQVDFFQGNFFLTDTSTNGCWLKGADKAIGKGNRIQLGDNSVVMIGPYELHFRLVEAVSTELDFPFAGNGHAADAPLDEDLLPDDGSDSIRQIINGISPSRVSGVDDTDAAAAPDLAGEPLTSLASPAQDSCDQANETPLSDGADSALDSYFKGADAVVEKIPTDWDFNDPAPSSLEAHANQQTFAATTETKKQDELAGPGASKAGINGAQGGAGQPVEDRPVKKDQQDSEAVATLSHRLGVSLSPEQLQNPGPFIEDIADVVNEALTGIICLLNGRAVFKQSSRLSMTTIQPRSNNPLKFSVDKQDALDHLFSHKKSAYLGAQDAVRQAITDLQIHEMAFVAGLQAALGQVLESLSPQQIEKNTAASQNKLRSYLAAPKYWQQYKITHQQLQSRINENLNEFLGQDFARAYEQQVSKLNQEHQESSK